MNIPLVTDIDCDTKTTKIENWTGENHTPRVHRRPYLGRILKRQYTKINGWKMEITSIEEEQLILWELIYFITILPTKSYDFWSF